MTCPFVPFIPPHSIRSQNMPKAQDSALTADEKCLLVVAAKLVNITHEYAVRPPHSTPVITFWNNKVQEELVHFPFFCTHI